MANYEQGDAAFYGSISPGHPIRWTANPVVAATVRAGLAAGLAVENVEGVFLVYLDGDRVSVESLTPSITGNFQTGSAADENISTGGFVGSGGWRPNDISDPGNKPENNV